MASRTWALTLINLRGEATTYAICMCPPQFRAPGLDLEPSTTVWYSVHLEDGQFFGLETGMECHACKLAIAPTCWCVSPAFALLEANTWHHRDWNRAALPCTWGESHHEHESTSSPRWRVTAWKYVLSSPSNICRRSALLTMDLSCI